MSLICPNCKSTNTNREGRNWTCHNCGDEYLLSIEKIDRILSVNKENTFERKCLSEIKKALASTGKNTGRGLVPSAPDPAMRELHNTVQSLIKTMLSSVPAKSLAKKYDNAATKHSSEDDDYEVVYDPEDRLESPIPTRQQAKPAVQTVSTPKVQEQKKATDLVTCPDCGRSGVSHRGSCPGCGCNIKEYLAEQAQIAYEKSPKGIAAKKEAEKLENYRMWERCGWCLKCGGLPIKKVEYYSDGSGTYSNYYCSKCGEFVRDGVR